MIRAVCPESVADLKTGFVTGWNIQPNVQYTISVYPGATSVAVWLFDGASGAYVAGGAALVGTDQPVTLLSADSPGLGMVDADLGYHLLVTSDGTEPAQTFSIGPFVDSADHVSAMYTVDDIAVVQATAVIREGTHYTDDASIMCPLWFDGLLGDVVSATVHGSAIVGDIESASFQAGPSSMADVITIRSMSAILPDAPVVIVHPTVSDDTAETDASTVATGYVLTNDSSGLTVVAVDGIAANVGVAVPGSNGGVFTIAADGAWTFDPDGDFAALSGSDTAETSVTYHASNVSAEAMAILTVTVSSGAAVAWTPAEITTELWLDAADDGTITLNGANVSQWEDKSGHGRHATQGTTARQPAKIANGIQFDGVDDFLSILVPQVLGQQVIAVIDTATTQTGSRIFLNRTYTGSPYPPAIYLGSYDGGKNNYPSVYWGANWQNNYLSQVKRLAILGFSILSGSTEIRVDGGDADPATTVQTVLGSWNEISTVPTYNQQSAFVLQELIIFNSTSQTTRQYVEGYLAHKWGLVASLPANHPYKSAPPTV